MDSRALLLACSSPLRAQASPNMAPGYQQTYDRLLQQIRQIAIFDDHGHPGFAEDTNVDAMASPPGHAPLRLNLDNPELIAASKDLFDYPFSDNSPGAHQVARCEKSRVAPHLPRLSILRSHSRQAQRGDDDGQPRRHGKLPRPQAFPLGLFRRLVSLPLDNSDLTERNIDEGVYVPMQEKKLKGELAQAGLNALPGAFPAYLAFVSKILEQNRSHGGVSIKFEIAYFRTLHFDDPPQADAAKIYDRYHAGGKPSAAEHAIFEDYMFRYLLREAGRLHLAVQIHTAVGTGDFFSVTGGNVLNLENVLRDPRYSNVNFVLLHGGYPFQNQAIWLTARENVYLDSSLMGIYLYPKDLAEVLRHWLLLYPEKVVFGSDAFPFNEAIGAEESDWLAVESARTALAAALSGMILDGEVTEQQALKFAHGYLHDNAARIYPQPAQ